MKELNFDNDFLPIGLTDDDNYDPFDGMQIRDGEHLDDVPEDDEAYDAFVDEFYDFDESETMRNLE